MTHRAKGEAAGIVCRVALLVLVAMLGASPGAEAGAIELRGLVTAEEQPLPGVEVQLLPWLDERGEAELWLSGKLRPEPLARATSDARGTYSLAVPAPGNYFLRLEAAGKAPLELPLLGVVEERELPMADLEREASLLVSLRDGEGRPFAGAWVRVREARRGRAPRAGTGWRPAEWRAATGGDGAVRVARHLGERRVVEAFAPGCLPVEAEVGAKARLELTLLTAPSLTATVLGPDRAPRGGAMALLGTAKWPLPSADATGTLRLPAAGKRSLPLVLRSRAGERTTAALPASASAEGKPIPFELAPARSLAGRVVDEVDRRPIAEALVWGEDPGQAVRTDATGGYRLDGLAQEVLVVSAAASDHQGTTYRGAELIGPRGVGPTLALEPAATLVGRVLDRFGTPVVAAELAAEPAPRRSTHGMWMTGETIRGRSGLDGRFRLAGVATTAVVTLGVIHRDFAPWREELPLLAPGPAPARSIVLSDGRSAVGKVRDTEERPVAGAVVELFDAAKPEPRAPWESAERRAMATSDREGQFVLLHVGAGSYDLRVAAGGFAPLQVPGLKVEEGVREANLGVVTLAPGASLEGRAVDSSGRALEGVSIWAEPATAERSLSFRFMTTGLGEPATRSAADGWFRIDNLAPQEPLIVVGELPGYGMASANQVSVPREEPLRLVLAPRGVVAGKVADSEGRPIPGASVAAFMTREMGNFRSSGWATLGEPVKTNQEGAFRIEAVEPGNLEIGAWASGYSLPAPTKVELPPGGTVEGAEVVLSAGARVSGRVLGPDGEPRAGNFVVFNQGRGSVAARGISDAEGNFSADGIPLGRIQLQTRDFELGNASAEIEVVPGENAAELRFAPGGEVSGRVVRAGGVGVPGADVLLHRLELGTVGPRMQVSGADGSFRFRALPRGLYRLEASADGAASTRLPEPVKVGEAAVTGLELLLGSGGALHGRVVGLALAEMPSVEVMARSIGAPGGGRATLDYAGAFHFDHLAAGEWIVSARHVVDGRRVEKTVSIPAEGAQVEVELELPRGFRISGRVSRQGQPASGLQVFVQAQERNRKEQTATDVDGRFALSGFEAGTYNLQLWARRSSLHEEEITLDGDRDLDIQLAAARLRGRSVDAGDRRPVAGAVLTLVRVGATSSDIWRAQSTERSDGGGSFLFDAIAPGSYTLRVAREGYEAVERTVEVSEVAAEELVVELTASEGLLLDLISPGGVRAGQVRVALRGADGRIVAWELLEPDAGGRVRFGTAPRGSWELLVQSDESALARLPVVAPGGPFAVPLSPGATLEVVVPELAEHDAWVPLRVVDAQGRPLEAHFGSQLRTDWRLSRGQTRLGGLSPGRWELSAQLPGGREVKGAVDVLAGALNRVTLE